MIPLSGYAKAKKYVDIHSQLTEREIIQLKKRNPGPCLTISRQSGIDTHKICNELVSQLSQHYKSDWAFFDKDLIRKVIEDHQLPVRFQKFLTEERIPTISQMLNELMGIHPPIMKLVHKMANTILNLAEIGNVILIGRGSNVITSHLKNAFHIRLVAPIDYRVKLMQESKDISKEQAKTEIIKEDSNRRDFLIRTFKKEIDDPLLYHLVLNIQQFSFEQIIQNITNLVKNNRPYIPRRVIPITQYEDISII